MAKNMWQLKKKKKKRKHYHIKWTMVSKMYGNSNSLRLNFVKWESSGLLSTLVTLTYEIRNQDLLTKPTKFYYNKENDTNCIISMSLYFFYLFFLNFVFS